MFVACVVAAELWNNFGYFKEWRINKNNPKWKGFNKKAMRNDLILGVCLGIGVQAYQYVVAGTIAAINIPQITDFITFAAAVGALWGVVAFVDKVFVGGFGGEKNENFLPN